MIYDRRKDTHDSLPTVLLYASPNVNARYTADSISSTVWDGDYPECAACHRTKGPWAVHHEPPRSKGGLLLATGIGQFVVKPTLLLLCESCHRARHDETLRFEWRFDTPEDEELFLSGRLFARGYAEHDERFWEHGSLIATRDGVAWEVRR